MRLPVLMLGSLLIASSHGASATPVPSVPNGFTFAAGGDLIGPYHTLQGARDPAFFRFVVPLFRNADVGFANQEGSIFDLKTFPYYPAAETGGGLPLSPSTVAGDLKAMGITVVSKANNHATDWGTEGLVYTMKTLAAAGVAFAGSGYDLTQARAPVYLTTAKGIKVAVVDCASSFTPMSVAGPPGDRRGQPTRGRPGISALHVQRVFLLPPRQIAALRAILPAGAASSSAGEIDLGEEAFRGSTRLGSTWEMDKADLAAILDSVREARKHADFVIFSIHAHETAQGAASEDPTPADFEPRLFHMAIDAGADVVVRNGPHHLNGIEIYKGRPIFYSLGSLFFDFGGKKTYTISGGPTITFPNDWYETVVPVVRYESGRASEIKLYPMVIESSTSPTGGAPHPASRASGVRILDRLRTLSAPFGTQLQIKNGIGVIRIAP